MGWRTTHNQPAEGRRRSQQAVIEELSGTASLGTLALAPAPAPAPATRPCALRAKRHSALREGLNRFGLFMREGGVLLRLERA